MTDEEKSKIIADIRFKSYLCSSGIADTLWEQALSLIKELQSENAEITRKARELELALFLVVRNSKVLPIGLRLNKSNQEITDMTFETVEKIKESINYDEVEKLIKGEQDD